MPGCHSLYQLVYLLQDAMSGEAGTRSTTPVSVKSPQQAKQPGGAASKAGQLSAQSGARSAPGASRPGTANGRPATAGARGKATASKGNAAEADAGLPHTTLQATSAFSHQLISAVRSVLTLPVTHIPALMAFSVFC